VAKFAGIPKKVSLEFLGETFKGAFLIFKELNVTQLRKLDELEGEEESWQTLVAVLTEQFISGKAPNPEGELQEVKKSDLEELLTITTVNQITQELTGGDELKKS